MEIYKKIVRKLEINKCSRNEFEYCGFAVSVNIHIHNQIAVGGILFRFQFFTCLFLKIIVRAKSQKIIFFPSTQRTING